MAQYTVVSSSPGGVLDVADKFSSLQENGKEILRGKLDIGDRAAAALKGLVMGPMTNFNIFSAGGEKVAYAKRLISPSRLEIYKEPEHQIMAVVRLSGRIPQKWTVSDARNQPICVIAGRGLFVPSFEHAIYDSTGKNQIGRFFPDEKTGAPKIECSDPKFTPIMILATWLFFEWDVGI